jgi:hypothetical protein
MQVEFNKDGKADFVKVSSKPTALLMILTTVALLLILQASTVLLVQPLDTALTALVVVNLICGGWLVLVCAEQLVPLTLTLDANGLRCQRLVTHKVFAWDDIAALKLSAAGAAADNAKTDSRGRVGLGVVLRVAGKSTARDTKTSQSPTVQLFSADQQFAEKMLEIIERVQKFQVALNAKPQERWKKAAQPQQQTQFRKKPNITMPA